MTDINIPWYHGSPAKLNLLRNGSMVTPFEAVAKAFSHKPTLLAIPEGMESVKHNGEVPGYLYVVSEEVAADDLRLLADTGETHWETQRDLRVDLIAEVPIDDPPMLIGDELRQAEEKQSELGDGSHFDR